MGFAARVRLISINRGLTATLLPLVIVFPIHKFSCGMGTFFRKLAYGVEVKHG